MVEGSGAATGSVRLWLRAEGVALLAAATALFAMTGGDWWLFALLFLAPDLAMLGYLRNERTGAALYNAAHSTFGPLALAGLGMSTMPEALPLALIWLAHVGFDRALGYGLKYGSGFGDTHLGRIGRQAAEKATR
jgi:hypothetical protein